MNYNKTMERTPHNIILELAISYGYPVTILFISTIVALLIMSSKKVFDKNQSSEFNNFEKPGHHFLLFVSHNYLTFNILMQD